MSCIIPLDMLYCKHNRENQRNGLPDTTTSYFIQTAVISVSNGGCYRFPLKIVKHNPTRATMNIQNWINSAYVIIGNSLLSFDWRVSPSEKRVSRPVPWSPISKIYHICPR